ncbi:inositol monophosphatase [Echinicola strongylocentroti]|uniref:Inositol-1-monophosphatase n=1 Tax=Echinicola strongylocentroti TaxID=1795355 RepID=A0A2Z4IIJ3_9BACT|nr:inositol monophosphatase family protein [Echinicola strongylocentroti]AWW30510.1 inositol monophosphatase [Echinicola strongylocentroti]
MELNELLDNTIAIAKEAGAFIRKERQRFDLKKVEHKGFNDLVSYVDKEAEKIVVSGLQAILPEAGFITEEGTINKEGELYNWIVDPLDGTTNFVHGVPVFSVSIALMKEEEIILGVVYEVNNNECFYATKGGGAFCNDTAINVSPTKDMAGSLIATGFPYSAFDEVDKYLALLKDIIQHSHGIRRMGSAAVDLCYVAAGRMDGYFEYNLNSYDVAGGVIILQEAGGKVSDFKGGDNYIFGRELVGSNEKTHGELLEMVRKYW